MLLNLIKIDIIKGIFNIKFKLVFKLIEKLCKNVFKVVNICFI